MNHKPFEHCLSFCTTLCWLATQPFGSSRSAYFLICLKTAWKYSHGPLVKYDSLTFPLITRPDLFNSTKLASNLTGLPFKNRWLDSRAPAWSSRSISEKNIACQDLSAFHWESRWLWLLWGDEHTWKRLTRPCLPCKLVSAQWLTCSPVINPLSCGSPDLLRINMVSRDYPGLHLTILALDFTFRRHSFWIAPDIQSSPAVVSRIFFLQKGHHFRLCIVTPGPKWDDQLLGEHHDQGPPFQLSGQTSSGHWVQETHKDISEGLMQWCRLQVTETRTWNMTAWTSRRSVTMMTATGYRESDLEHDCTNQQAVSDSTDLDHDCTNQQAASDSTVILLLMHQEPLR